MSTIEAHKAAFEAALKSELKKPGMAEFKKLPRIQQDRIRERIRRESAREVDTAERAKLFEAHLPREETLVLARAYTRLSTKPSVIRAACEAYASHGLDVARIDEAINRAMSENSAPES